MRSETCGRDGTSPSAKQVVADVAVSVSGSAHPELRGGHWADQRSGKGVRSSVKARCCEGLRENVARSQICGYVDEGGGTTCEPRLSFPLRRGWRQRSGRHGRDEWSWRLDICRQLLRYLARACESSKPRVIAVACSPCVQTGAGKVAIVVQVIG